MSSPLYAAPAAASSAPVTTASATPSASGQGMRGALRAASGHDVQHRMLEPADASTHASGPGAAAIDRVQGAFGAPVQRQAAVQMDRPHHHHAGGAQTPGTQQAGAGGTPGPQAPAAPQSEDPQLGALRSSYRSLSMTLQQQISQYCTTRTMGRPYPPEAIPVGTRLLELENLIVASTDAHVLRLAVEAIHDVREALVPQVQTLAGANGNVFGGQRDRTAGVIAGELMHLAYAIQGTPNLAPFAAQLLGWNQAFFVRVGPPAYEAAPEAEGGGDGANSGQAGQAGEGTPPASGHGGIVSRIQGALRGGADPDAPQSTLGEGLTHLRELRSGLHTVMGLLRTYDQAAPRVEVVRGNVRNVLNVLDSPGGSAWHGARNAMGREAELSDPGLDINYITHLTTAAHVFANLDGATRARDAYQANPTSANALAFAEQMGNIISSLGASLEDAPAPLNQYAQILSRCNGRFFSNVSRSILHSVTAIEAMDADGENDGTTRHRGM